MFQSPIWQHQLLWILHQNNLPAKLKWNIDMVWRGKKILWFFVASPIVLWCFQNSGWNFNKQIILRLYRPIIYLKPLGPDVSQNKTISYLHHEVSGIIKPISSFKRENKMKFSNIKKDPMISAVTICPSSKLLQYYWHISCAGYCIRVACLFYKWRLVPFNLLRLFPPLPSGKHLFVLCITESVPILFCSVFAFCIPYISEIKRYLFVSVWLISLSIIPWILSTHIVASGKNICNDWAIFHSGKGNGNPLQWGSCLGNPMDRGIWQDAVHGPQKSQIQLSN